MTTGQISTVADDDISWCHDAIDEVSRTFAITVDRLDDPMATKVCVGYLCCRIADTIEDAGHIPPVERASLLRTYDRVLDPEDEETAATFVEAATEWIPERTSDSWSPDWAVVERSPTVIRTFEGLDAEPRKIMRAPIRELVAGMAMFTERHADTDGLRIQTHAELEEYCWYVAGTVGTLITGLLTRDVTEDRASELASNARSFALLLQLVNVAKDVARDYHEENNVYLPAEWLSEAGVTDGPVTAPTNREGVTAVISRVTEHASGYLDDAQRYLELLPERRGNTLGAWAIPYFLAVGTIRELRARPEDVLGEGNVKVSREEVYALVQRFEREVSRDELGELRTEIASGSFP